MVARLRCCCVALTAIASLQADDDPVDKVGRTATEWVKTRTETVRLESEWSGQRTLLQSAVEAINQRAQLIEEKRDGLKARTAQERSELETLEQRNGRADADLRAAEAKLKEADRALLALRPFLPPRLSAALELPYRSLAAPELSVSDRMQHTMTVLNRCLQFNHVVSAGEEVITLPGEPTPKALEVIYWGLGQGYALDRGTGKAWRGAPAGAGWEWEPHPEAAAELSRLLAVASDKADPAFVMLPTKLNHAAR